MLITSHGQDNVSKLFCEEIVDNFSAAEQISLNWFLK